jgi:AcrR family transcriptional regulator
VSPAPRHASDADILAAARAILEEDGLEGVTMLAIAGRVGVRPPSLYKHLESRWQLLKLVAEDAFADLGAAVDRAAASVPAGARRRRDSRARLAAIAVAYRDWAHAHPGAYRLLYAPLPAEARPSPAVGGAAAAALLDAVEGVVPDGEELAAARTLVAFANGFVTMELAGAFRMGGDIDAAYTYGVAVVVGAVVDRGRGGRG